MDERAKSLHANFIVAVMALAAAAAALALLPFDGPHSWPSDFALFLFPWMETIRNEGLASLAGEFAGYTPPYIYLLNLAALVEPAVGTVAAIKLINLPFVASAALGIEAIVRVVTGDRYLSKMALAVTLVCPTLLINSFAWGQCDAIFASFVIWFVYFAVRDRPVAACVMLGIAVSFKLQALFVSPLLLTLLIWKRLRIWHLLIIPATYVVMMIPAALAGRPWSELLTVYVGQAAYNRDLSMNAPNFWWFLRGHGFYRIGVVIGLAIAAVAGVMVVARSIRLKPNAQSVLLIVTVCAALMPALLPKMAARYFIVADLLTIATAFARPSLWPAAVLIQIGSLLAYMSYFFAQWGTTRHAFIPMTFGVGLLVYALLDASRHRTRERLSSVA